MASEDILMDILKMQYYNIEQLGYCLKYFFYILYYKCIVYRKVIEGK